jgi:hypothetical protein
MVVVGREMASNAHHHIHSPLPLTLTSFGTDLVPIFLYWHNSTNFGPILMVQQVANVLITTLGSFLLFGLCQLAKYSSSYRCAKIGGGFQLVSKNKMQFLSIFDRSVCHDV